MARSDGNEKFPIPLPLLGLNTVTPFNVDFNSGFARELTNWAIQDGKLKVRPSVREHVTRTGGAFTGRYVSWFDFSGGDTHAILDNGSIDNITTGVNIGTIGGGVGEKPHQIKHSSLTLLIGCMQPRSALTPFGAWAFTTIAITATVITSACSHKGRLYVCDGTTIEYSSLGAVAGALTGSFAVNQFMEGQSVLRMFSVSASPNVSTDNLFVVFGSAGKVLVYAGDYPAASNWQLVGSYNMPSPVSRTSILEVDGDLFIAGYQYSYWFRDLFNSGAQSAYENSPTLPIENVWAASFWSALGNPEDTFCFYDSDLDAIYCQVAEKGGVRFNLATIANYQNEAFWFVYFRKYKAWAIWFTTPMFGPMRKVGSTIYGTGYRCEVKKLDDTKMVDEYFVTSTSTIPIEATWKTPYVEPFDSSNTKVNGVRIFFENTLNGYFERVRSIFDFSDYNSVLGWATQSMVTQILPGRYGEGTVDAPVHTYNQYNPLVGGGASGGGVSFEFKAKRKDGTSDTQNLSLYAATALIEKGSDMI